MHHPWKLCTKNLKKKPTFIGSKKVAKLLTLKWPSYWPSYWPFSVCIYIYIFFFGTCIYCRLNHGKRAKNNSFCQRIMDFHWQCACSTHNKQAQVVGISPRVSGKEVVPLPHQQNPTYTLHIAIRCTWITDPEYVMHTMSLWNWNVCNLQVMVRKIKRRTECLCF